MASLTEQIRGYAHVRETKADVIDYYQSEYPGRGQSGWKQRLVNTLAALTGMKPKNLEKRFDTQRRNNPEPRNAHQYKELGKHLPPRLPDDGFQVTGIVWVKFSDGQCEERDVDETITKKEAATMLDMNTRDAAQLLVNKYMEEEDTDEPTASIGDCNPPDLTVTPLDDNWEEEGEPDYE